MIKMDVTLPIHSRTKTLNGKVPMNREIWPMKTRLKRLLIKIGLEELSTKTGVRLLMKTELGWMKIRLKEVTMRTEVELLMKINGRSSITRRIVIRHSRIACMQEITARSIHHLPLH